MLVPKTTLVNCYPNFAQKMTWDNQMSSFLQLILSLMLVILMDHAVGWNTTPIHCFWLQASSNTCNHHNHTTVTKPGIWWHAKTWERSELEEINTATITEIFNRLAKLALTNTLFEELSLKWDNSTCKNQQHMWHVWTIIQQCGT